MNAPLLYLSLSSALIEPTLLSTFPDGFRRITQGPDAGAYYHELFLKGRPQLCMRMQRQKVKGTGHKLPADAESEPNFYSMPSSTHDVEESPGMQGLRGAANLLQGISAGLPPSAWPNQSQSQSSLTYTASTTNPQHWRYAKAVATKSATALDKKEDSQEGSAVDEARQPQEVIKDGDDEDPSQGKDENRLHGDNATDKP